MSTISLVVAIAENYAIGKNNQLLWHLPADLKHFKTITSGHSIIMGRKTFESIGKPLPNRRNIIISRQTNLEIPGIELVNSLSQALQLTESEHEIFIIGGAMIYEEALPYAQKIYLTRVKASFEADAFFPKLPPEEWDVIDSEYFNADDKNPFGYSIETLVRRKN
ncbi:MAG: dihydrofolate reductase [Pedobacter sp.]|nr:MAG: dihydrofolate reductase [Pedobacter sp.]